MNCFICGRRNPDRCHIRSRGAGGPDCEENIVLMCRVHHSLQHAKGWLFLTKQFPIVRVKLLEKGWTIADSGKLERLRPLEP